MAKLHGAGSLFGSSLLPQQQPRHPADASAPFYCARLLAQRSSRLGCLVLVPLFALSLLFVHSHSPLDFFPSAGGSPQHWAAFRAPKNRVVGGRNGETLTGFLDDRWPRRGVEAPHVWLTMADEKWVDQGTAALKLFVERLNVERAGLRETVLLVLCLDEICMESCARRGIYAYGGYRFTRPEQILYVDCGVSTWPKLAGLIEILEHRDTFFVDSDVHFLRNPYPFMEPHMRTSDVLAQENMAFEHINTGWMWLRSCDKTVQAWKDVLALDMEEVSRDQMNFNKVLGSTELRLWDDRNERPLRDDFTARDGLRVHVLDPNIFRSYHFEHDRQFERHEAVYLHVTCGDDTAQKFAIAKEQGYWGDVDGYYSSPHKVLSINHLGGAPDDLTQIVQILLSLSHYTQRALAPPRYAIFSDVSSPRARRSYAAFPFPQLADALQIPIVEPDYTTHVLQHFLGSAALNQAQEAPNPVPVLNTTLSQLLDVAEIDVRQYISLADLVARLSSPSLAGIQTLRLMNFDWPGDANWRSWELPEPVKQVKPCAGLEEWPGCGGVCKWENDERGVRVEGTWPEL